MFRIENKKLGVVLFVIGILLLSVIFGYNSKIKNNAREECYPENEKCLELESVLDITHFSIGVFSFIIALGFYLLFFAKGEEAILKRLEEEKRLKLKESKFDIVLNALDENEKKVLRAIKGQDGITQQTLRYKTDLSKAKISQVINSFEKKGLIKRKIKGKTYSVYLIQDI